MRASKLVLTWAVLLLVAIILRAQAPAPARAGAASSQRNQPTPPTPPATTSTQAVIGSASHIRPAPDHYAFPNGQVLHYTAEWRIWSAGTATVRIDPAGTEEHVSVTADSIGVVALLYRVQDRFNSYFDGKTFCSSLVNKHSEEGLHKRETAIKFDYARRKAVLDERNLKTGETKHTEEDIPGCVTDVLSAIYYVGSLPLEPGSTYMFPLNDGGKMVDVQAHVEGREEVQTEAGKFKTIRVQPEAQLGVLKNRGKIWVWYTDDAAHTPVQMRARLFWGTLTIRLVRMDRQ